MLWVVYCLDRPNTREARDKNRAVHRAYLDTYSSRIFFSGPLVADDDSGQVGSMFILNLESRADAQAFIDNETYNTAGIFETVTIRRMRGGRFNPALAEMAPTAIDPAVQAGAGRKLR